MKNILYFSAIAFVTCCSIRKNTFLEYEVIVIDEYKDSTGMFKYRCRNFDNTQIYIYGSVDDCYSINDTIKFIK